LDEPSVNEDYKSTLEKAIEEPKISPSTEESTLSSKLSFQLSPIRRHFNS
jgi:hypothetical protein